jgi:2-oxoglutarate dehydrogenase E1 component
VGYRRHGHNEADQPAFTQPLMYKVVATHPTAREIYAARLVREAS